LFEKGNFKNKVSSVSDNDTYLDVAEKIIFQGENSL